MGNGQGRGKFLKRAGLVILMGACAMLLSASQSSALLIDHFEANADIDCSTAGMGPHPASATITETGITGLSPATRNVLGGTRQVDLQWVSGDDGGVNQVQMLQVNSYLDLNDSTTLVGILKLTYNGPSDFVTHGAGSGWDLTDGGASASVNIRYLASDLGSTTKCTLTDYLGNSFTLSMLSPSGPSVSAFLLSGFIGVDETNIRKIVFEIDTVPSGDYRIDSLSSGTIPEPLTMAGMFLGLGSLGAYIRKRRMA